jgi:hypothetical protein
MKAIVKHQAPASGPSDRRRVFSNAERRRNMLRLPTVLPTRRLVGVGLKISKPHQDPMKTLAVLSTAIPPYVA